MNQDRKLRWGILGTAKIAREWMVPAIQSSCNGEVVAIASRDVAKAQDFAAEFNIGQAYGSYEALLADPSVEAIYNPSPNHMHVPLSLMAIGAGKHVLCEKPLGLTASELQPLMEAAAAHPNLVVMEAFMYRFHPQWRKVRELLDNDAIGQVNGVEASFTYFNCDANNVRNKTGIGGGGLLDIGCYCVSAARFIFGREPKRVTAVIENDPNFGVDRHASGVLDFAPGMARFYCSTQSDSSQIVKINGSKGSLVIESPFYARSYPSRLILTQNSEEQIIALEPCNHYITQVETFTEAVFSGQPAPTPLKDAVGNMMVIDALFSSAESGAWLEIA